MSAFGGKADVGASLILYGQGGLAFAFHYFRTYIISMSDKEKPDKSVPSRMQNLLDMLRGRNRGEMTESEIDEAKKLANEIRDEKSDT